MLLFFNSRSVYLVLFMVLVLVLVLVLSMGGKATNPLVGFR